MNKIEIVGRLTQDPELKAGGSGIEFCNFTVAVDRRRKDKDGNKMTDFIPCTCFGKTAAFFNQYFHKGDGVVLSGRLESNKGTDEDGNARTWWSVSVDELEFAPGRSGGSGSVSAAEFTEEPDDGNLPF